MSRVDEAMRRAAGVASGEPGQLPDEGLSSLPTESAEVGSLSRTMFPVEMPHEHRPRRSAAAPRPEAAVVVPTDEPAADSPRPLIERIDSRLAQKVVVDDRVLPASKEQYRRLAASLHHAQSANAIKVVMIASAMPGEGKTLTASNLALTFSESYQRSVLLIDGDLRKPGLHTVFNVDNSSGLSDGLYGTKERKLPVHEVSSRLALLPAGVARHDPMAGLTSDRMRRLLDEARESFDWIFIDTPPVAFLSDANLLSAMVDAAVLVVKAGSTPYDLAQRAIEAIGRDRVIGVVLNRADQAEDSARYAYYSGYYGSYAGSTQQS